MEMLKLLYYLKLKNNQIGGKQVERMFQDMLKVGKDRRKMKDKYERLGIILLIRRDAGCDDYVAWIFEGVRYFQKFYVGLGLNDFLIGLKNVLILKSVVGDYFIRWFGFCCSGYRLIFQNCVFFCFVFNVY